MAGKNDGAPGSHERRLMESESRWLQKALFALSKAEDDRVKLAAASKDDGQPIQVRIKGKLLDLATVRGAMEEAVRERAEELRASLQSRHPILR